nr:hypothetical protein [Tanacetum cinerariifolium]
MCFEHPESKYHNENLDNLRSTIKEEDEASEVLDPRDVSGSILLEIIDFAILCLLLEPLVLGVLGMSSLRGTVLVAVILVKGYAFPTKVKVLTISSGSTTTHFDISLPDYEALSFNNDHIKEISSGSTTTHSDISLSEYDSFTFDLSNDQCPPTDRRDFTREEFADELAHIISPPEYDCFYFWNSPDPGELMSIFNSKIRKNLSITCVNLPIEGDHSPLLAYVVWIFLAYLTYPVIPPYLHPFGNEDTIFDPGITINHVYLFKPGLSHRCGAFKKFNTHRSHLNEWPMIINGKNTPILDVILLLPKDFILQVLISSASIGNHEYFYEFTDELAHNIYPPEYDCFCFKDEPNSGDFTIDVVEDKFPTREPKVRNALPTHPALQLNLDFILSSESFFAYVVWIFLPFLSYSVAPQYILSFRNEDTIFDPGICSYHISSFILDVSHRSGIFVKFKVLNESQMKISFSTCSLMDQ